MVRVTLVNGVNAVDIPCLDDTGSSFLSLYPIPDCALLGLTFHYGHFIGPILLSTANGIVQRMLLEVNVQLLDTNMNAIGPW